jgi:hypothetical protein
MKHTIPLKRSHFHWYVHDSSGVRNRLFCLLGFNEYWEIPDSVKEIDLVLSTTAVKDAYQIELNADEQGSRFECMLNNIKIHTLHHGVEVERTSYSTDKYFFQLFKGRWPKKIWAYIEYEV